MLDFQLMKNDQAAGLRRIMAKPKPSVVSVLSASTPQAQTRFLTNLASTLANQGSNVIVMHASESALAPSYELEQAPTLLEVIQDKHTIQQAIKSTSYGFSSVKLMQKELLSKIDNYHITSQLNLLFNQVVNQYDMVLVDAALNKKNVLPLNQLNQSEIIIQLTNKPESITQAYSLIKMLCNELGRRSFGIIIDNATHEQAQTVFTNIAQVAKRFIQIELQFFGAIPADTHLTRASKLGRSVIDAFPFSIASTALKQIAQRLEYKHDSVFNHKQASYN
ncbi:MAG: MotR [Methylotenera sp.]|nr:MAG: MotR [Methylotenera sp.]